MPQSRSGPGESKDPRSSNRFARVLILWAVLGVAFLALMKAGSFPMGGPLRDLTYSELFDLLEGRAGGQRVETAELSAQTVEGRLSDGTRFRVQIPDNDPDLLRLLRERAGRFAVRPPAVLMSVIWSFLPMLIFIAFLWFVFYRGAQGGGRILAFGKSRARQITPDHVKTTFQDVAGVDEAKEELQEVIDYLRSPKKFQRLGGKIPKGVLLIGPPGCGKTLLARAVSGEANVPFLSISGSDFVEMFVGVGASRVRDLFEQAKRSAKTTDRGAIIFIDEIDAVGRQRFAGIGGGHDEREQTLNALLVEMDGFDTREGIVLVAATNRPDVLDPALLRPGRFDRTVVIDRPDIKGREQILQVHTRRIKLAPNVDLHAIAQQTPGFSGADLANLANEAALLGARRDRDAVHMEELEASIERVMAGPERRSRIISDYEKSIVAYHESGHALVALFVDGADPLHKVSIIPRGTAALGYTMQMPIEDRYITTRKELLGRLTVLLGGRASEELVVKEMTTGAQNDLEIATETARRMVCEFGMSEDLGHLTLGKREGQVFLGRDIVEQRNYSEQTAVVIDREIRKIIDACYERARTILSTHQAELEKLAAALREREVLDGEEVKRIVGLAPGGDGPPAAPAPA